MIEDLLSDNRRLDMLVGALEGGSNYWYNIKEDGCKLIDEVNSDKSTPFSVRMWEAIKSGKTIPIYDIKDNDGEKIGDISYTRIVIGEDLMYQQQPIHFGNILTENDDAETADVWFQFVVLKSIVYG